MADVGLPHAAIREQVADAIDLVVCQARAADGTRRVTAVAEVVRVAGGAAAREIYTLRDGRADLARAARRGAGREAGEGMNRCRSRRRMSAAVLLAAAAGAAGVLGAWDVLATAAGAAVV